MSRTRDNERGTLTLTPKTAVYSDLNGELKGATLTDGQLLIGSTANAPISGQITGTTNQLIVTNSAGNITLSTPQDLATTSSPTFGQLTMSTLPTNRLCYINSTNKISTMPPIGDGFLLIGQGGTIPAVGRLAGTTNRINVANASGSITLSTPQDIATTSSPTFAGLTAQSINIDTDFHSSIVSSAPRITFDTNDYITYDRTDNKMVFAVDNVAKLILASEGAVVSTLHAAGPSNQIVLGDSLSQTINAANVSASRIVTLPDAGLDSSFVLTEGAQTINGSKTFADLSITTASATAALTLTSEGGAQSTFSRTNGIGTRITDVSGGGYIQIAGATISTNNNTLDNGSGALTVNQVYSNSLTADMPVKSNGSKQLISATINLATDVSGVLPSANGGIGGALTGTANQITVTDSGSGIALSMPSNVTITGKMQASAMINTSACYIRLNGAGTVVPSGVLTKIYFGSHEGYDPSSLWTTTYFDITSNFGWYRIHAQLRFPDTAAAATDSTGIAIDVAPFSGGVTRAEAFAAVDGTGRRCVSLTTIYNVVESSAVTLRAFHVAGVDLTVQSLYAEVVRLS